jgi:UTP--glucose-1-phosphate uridylyltransferase
MRVRKAVFPAAGLGTRFLPATKAQPKEMLPIVDKPLIQYALEEAVAAGLQSVIIVTCRGKNAIEDHFDRSQELEQALAKQGKADLLRIVQEISDLTSVCYVRQKEPLGLGHAILTARDLVGDEPFAILLGDDVIDARVPCIRQLLDAFDRYRCPVLAVQEVPPDQVGQYGIIDGRPLGDGLYEIRDLVEKPPPELAPSNLAVIGRYVLTPGIFAELEQTTPGAGGEIQLTDGLRRLLKGQALYGLAFRGTRYDAGSKLGFLKATVEFALKRDDLAADFRAYLGSLGLGPAGRA